MVNATIYWAWEGELDCDITQNDFLRKRLLYLNSDHSLHRTRPWGKSEDKPYNFVVDGDRIGIGDDYA
jgi:hypothetical protein